MKFTTGAVFGNRYTLGDRIAVGGMSEVWQATDQVLGRVVAIKLLSPALAQQTGFERRFREEARNTAALTHPNIAAVYDYGENDGASWLVMELVEGQPLSAIISEQGAQSPERTSAIIAQAALALHAAHEAGVVHRDVKPANILVRPDGAVKLTDFGIARATDAVPITRTGEVMGTAQYISPEQATGQAVSPKSDLYGLGCVAHEMLTGHRVFDEGSPVATAMAHVSTPPPALPPQVPAHIADVVMACLAKDPSQRPPTARAVADALRGAATGGFAVTQAIPTAPATQRLGAPTAVAPASPPPTRGSRVVEEPEEEESRRNPLLWILPLLLVLALAGWGLAQAGVFDSEPSAPSTSPTTSEETEAPTQTETTQEPQQVQVSAGDYEGRTFDVAAAALRDLGLGVRRENVESDEPAGTVIGVDPSGSVDPESVITLRVSQGPAPEPTTQAPAPAPTVPEQTQEEQPAPPADPGDGNGNDTEPAPQEEQPAPGATGAAAVPGPGGGAAGGQAGAAAPAPADGGVPGGEAGPEENQP